MLSSRYEGFGKHVLRHRIDPNGIIGILLFPLA